MSDILTDNPQGNLNDIMMAKQVAEALHEHYPGHLWGVNADGATGMLDVRNLGLSGRWGFRLHLKKIYSASALKADVIRAGGEILERYKQSRGKFNAAEYSDLKADYTGTFKPET